MKTIFDFDDKKSFKPYKLIKTDILHYVFYRNIFNYHNVKNICKTNCEIYCTDNFKTNSPYRSIYTDNYDETKSLVFENIVYDNIELILKSMNTVIKTANIYSQKSDNRINKIIDCISKYADVIYLITDSTDFYNTINSYSIKKHGMGLLKSLAKECDITVILNTNKTDFYKSGRYVINLHSGHAVFNCNVLWDFYNKKNDLSNITDIKKAFFIEKTPDFLNLRWKILKKS